MQLDKSKNDYSVYEYEVPKASYSRYRYTANIRKDLVKRYNKLLKDAEGDSWPEFKEIDNDKCAASSFLLVNHCSDQKELSNMMSIVEGGHLIENATTIGRIREIIQRGEKTPFVITSSGHVVNNTQEDLKSAIFIIIAKNKYSHSKFSKTFNDRKNVHVCLREEVNQILSTHPERCAFTGMKEVCEFLQAALPAPDSLGAKTQRKSAEKRTHSSEDTSSFGPAKTQRVSTRKRKHSVENTFSFGPAKTQRKSAEKRTHSAEDTSSFGPAKTQRKSAEKRTNSTEDTFSFGPGKDFKRGKTSTSFLELCKENKEIKERTERLVDEIVGMFNRSNLLKDEHPSLCNTMQQCVTDKLLRDLRTLSESIESCRHRFSTFQVCVDADNISEKLKCDIEKKLKAYHITDYSIISSRVKQLVNVQVGSKVSAGSLTGTLGGFARTSEETSNRLWVLTSRHLANLSSDGKLYIADKAEVFSAKIMEQLKDYQQTGTFLDIAAASLEEGVENNCNTLYITENKTRVPGKLCEYDFAKLRGLKVHFCGASTELGLGTITIAEQHSVQPGGVAENYLIVEDREPEESDTRDKVKFCEGGDSGAIVCAESPDNYGEEVQLISMVQGEELNKEGSYNTVRLDKGLEELSFLAKKEFELC